MPTKEHNNIILKLGVALASKDLSTIKEIGEFIQNTGSDEFVSGGFWLFSYESKDLYLSNKFLELLDYNRNEVIEKIDFFYKTANHKELEKGFKMLEELIKNKSESCFINTITHTKKDGSILNVECSGTPLYKNNEPYIILGTHKI
jgi:hypothetical protein